MSNNIKEDLKNNDVFGLLNGSVPQPINEIQPVNNIDVKPIEDKPSVSDVKETTPKQVKKVVSDTTITKDNYKYKDKNKYISVNQNGKRVKIIDNVNGRLSKEGNYTITFKIDADIEQYLKNIDKITYIEDRAKNPLTATGKDATTYVNDLIRADLKKRLKLSDKEDDFNKWIDGYKTLL